MNTPQSRHHVLLIGIDAYRHVDPLQGSVNDIDALESVFLDRLAIPPSAIRKLAAPLITYGRTSSVPENEPTLENMTEALQYLGSSAVCPGDRVFIYYSGHGTQVFSRITRTAHEALVPVDAHAGGDLLFDYDVNAFLARIAQRTQDLTVVFDACCSAGATRSAFAQSHQRIRFCQLTRDVESVAKPRTQNAYSARSSIVPLDAADPGYVFVAAAQSCEAAHEVRNKRGIVHGAFTAAWLDSLAHTADADLPFLRWVDLWPMLRARVATVFPGQHPCLIGRDERRVLGGPFERRDAGLVITEKQGIYEIHGGSLVGLSAGAQIAVYGSDPPFFSTLHSASDVAARRGLLEVQSATLDSASAVAVGHVPPLESGARGRLVKPGIDDKLVVGLTPFDAAVAKYLEHEASCIVVPFDEPGRHIVDSAVGLSSDGSWWLGDDVFGPDAPLARIPRGDLATLARVITHDFHYRQPLRFAQRVASHGEILRVRILDAQYVARMEPEDLVDPALPEVEADEAGIGHYRLRNGHPVCFSVENRFSRPLYTYVINCASSGKVEILGPTQLEIPAQRRQTFWRGGQLGRVFLCNVSKGRRENVDRLVVIGTTIANIDLRSWAQEESFADIVATNKRCARDKEKPNIFATATIAKVRIVTA